jgi:hypothetical protein
MIKKLAIAFGIVFILVGILGFVPGATQNEHLLGIFHVNPAHNFVHLLTGGAALVAGLTSTNAAQLFFRVFGVIYALVAVLGFMAGDAPILGIISNNVANAWLHLVIAASSLMIGFAVKEPIVAKQSA